MFCQTKREVTHKTGWFSNAFNPFSALRTAYDILAKVSPICWKGAMIVLLNSPAWKFSEDVPLVEFMYLVFARVPGESYRRQLRSLLLYLCDVFRALINSLVCWVLLVKFSFPTFFWGKFMKTNFFLSFFLFLFFFSFSFSFLFFFFSVLFLLGVCMFGRLPILNRLFTLLD